MTTVNQPALKVAFVGSRWCCFAAADRFASIVKDCIVADMTMLPDDPDRYDWIFVTHYSHIVPLPYIESCRHLIAFHLGDLPLGRGGSPLQNRRTEGATITKLTAFQMTEALDAGPVYLKEDIALTGQAEAVYFRAMTLAGEMAARIVLGKLTPVPQRKDVATTFTPRRKPEQSEIDFQAMSLTGIRDHIDMLDAEGYPHAFVDAGRYRISFRRAGLRAPGCLITDAIIEERKS